MEARIAFWSIIGLLAVYRATFMITRDEGPFEIFQSLRDRFTKNDWIGRGIRCPYCVSFWASVAASPVVMFAAQGYLQAQYLLLPFAIAGGFMLVIEHIRLKAL